MGNKTNGKEGVLSYHYCLYNRLNTSFISMVQYLIDCTCIYDYFMKLYTGCSLGISIILNALLRVNQKNKLRKSLSS